MYTFLLKLRDKTRLSIAIIYCKVFRVERHIPNYLYIAQLERAIGWHLIALTCAKCGRVTQTLGQDDVCRCDLCGAFLDASRIGNEKYLEDGTSYIKGKYPHEVEGLTYSFGNTAFRAQEAKRIAAKGFATQVLPAVEDDAMLDGWDRLIKHKRELEELEMLQGAFNNGRSSNRSKIIRSRHMDS